MGVPGATWVSSSFCSAVSMWSSLLSSNQPMMVTQAAL
jgi:hypothetical protein